eukprot:UN33258
MLCVRQYIFALPEEEYPDAVPETPVNSTYTFEQENKMYTVLVILKIIIISRSIQLRLKDLQKSYPFPFRASIIFYFILCIHG